MSSEIPVHLGIGEKVGAGLSEPRDQDPFVLTLGDERRDSIDISHLNLKRIKSVTIPDGPAAGLNYFEDLLDPDCMPHQIIISRETLTELRAPLPSPMLDCDFNRPTDDSFLSFCVKTRSSGNSITILREIIGELRAAHVTSPAQQPDDYDTFSLSDNEDREIDEEAFSGMRSLSAPRPEGFQANNYLSRGPSDGTVLQSGEEFRPQLPFEVSLRAIKDRKLSRGQSSSQGSPDVEADNTVDNLPVAPPLLGHEQRLRSQFIPRDCSRFAVETHVSYKPVVQMGESGPLRSSERIGPLSQTLVSLESIARSSWGKFKDSFKCKKMNKTQA